MCFLNEATFTSVCVTFFGMGWGSKVVQGLTTIFSAFCEISLEEVITWVVLGTRPDLKVYGGFIPYTLGGGFFRECPGKPAIPIVTSRLIKLVRI